MEGVTTTIHTYIYTQLLEIRLNGHNLVSFEATIVRINNAYPIFDWNAPYIYIYIYTQLVAANWRIDLDTWIFVKTFQVSAFASPSLVLASSKHI